MKRVFAFLLVFSLLNAGSFCNLAYAADVNSVNTEGGNAVIYESTDRLLEAYNTYFQILTTSNQFGNIANFTAPTFTMTKPTIDIPDTFLVRLLFEFSSSLPEDLKTESWNTTVSMYNVLALVKNVSIGTYNSQYPIYNVAASVYNLAVLNYFNEYNTYIVKLNTYNQYVTAVKNFVACKANYDSLYNALNDTQKLDALCYLNEKIKSYPGFSVINVMLGVTYVDTTLNIKQPEKCVFEGNPEYNYLKNTLERIEPYPIVPLVANPVKLNGTIHKDIKYGDADCNNLDIYFPTNPKTTKGVIVFIHGGGFSSGTKEDMDYYCTGYTNKGYITATINYHLIGDIPTPENSALSVVQDVKNAIAKIKSYTSELGYQVESIGLLGTSAGGHIASLYAYSMADQSPIPIAFLANQSGPSIFNMEAWLQNYDVEEAAKMIGGLLGHEVTAEDFTETGVLRIQDELNAISPALMIDSNSVPTLAAYGKEDTIVPMYNGQIVQQQLINSGNPEHKFIWFEHSTHPLGNDPAKTAEFYQTLDQFCEKYFQK